MTCARTPLMGSGGERNWDCGSFMVAHMPGRQIAERHARGEGVAGLIPDAILVMGRRVADCIEPLDRVVALMQDLCVAVSEEASGRKGAGMEAQSVERRLGDRP